MVKEIIHPVDGYHLRALFVDFLVFWCNYGADGVDKMETMDLFPPAG